MKPWTLTLLTLLTTARIASATCQWQQDCSSYPCRQVRVCDDDIVSPSLAPSIVAPLPPLPSIPPLGTTSCHQVYVCAGIYCQWEELCK